MAEERMPFTSHLGELRKRIMVSVVTLLAGFLISFGFSERIFAFLTMPMKYDLTLVRSYPFAAFVERNSVSPLVFLAPAEALWVHLKISMVAGLIISVPVILTQFWKFISPGLLLKERKYAIPFVFIASGLFLTGAMFCFLIVLPLAMKFLLGYKTANLTAMISVEKYMDFCLKFILSFGAVFELPLVIVFLTRTGIVKPSTLSRNRKYAVLLAFVVAGVLTPTPDAFNQTLMALPIILLYEIGILASKLLIRKKKENAG